MLYPHLTIDQSGPSRARWVYLGTAKNRGPTGPRAGTERRRSGRASPEGRAAAAGTSVPEGRPLPPALPPGLGARSVADSGPGLTGPRPAPDRPQHKPWWTPGSSIVFHSPFWSSAQLGFFALLLLLFLRLERVPLLFRSPGALQGLSPQAEAWTLPPAVATLLPSKHPARKDQEAHLL